MPTLLLVDLGLDVQVDGQDDDVAGGIGDAHNLEGLGILKGDALRHLHHTEDDDQVRPGLLACVLVRNGSHGDARELQPGDEPRLKKRKQRCEESRIARNLHLGAEACESGHFERSCLCLRKEGYCLIRDRGWDRGRVHKLSRCDGKGEEKRSAGFW